VFFAYPEYSGLRPLRLMDFLRDYTGILSKFEMKN